MLGDIGNGIAMLSQQEPDRLGEANPLDALGQPFVQVVKNFELILERLDFPGRDLDSLRQLLPAAGERGISFGQAAEGWVSVLRGSLRGAGLFDGFPLAAVVDGRAPGVKMPFGALGKNEGVVVAGFQGAPVARLWQVMRLGTDKGTVGIDLCLSLTGKGADVTRIPRAVPLLMLCVIRAKRDLDTLELVTVGSGEDGALTDLIGNLVEARDLLHAFYF